MRSPSPFIFLFFVCLAFIGPTCHSEPKQTLLYEYDFNDGKIGPEWKNEGGDWAIDNGKVVSRDAQNKDLVLMKALPTDVAVEVEVVSHSPKIDVKFRTHGDPAGGTLHDAGAYSFILGGWGGTISTIARMNEHEPNRVEDKKARFEKDRVYKMKAVKKGGKIDWFIDGVKFLSYDDSSPLAPPQFAYFSFSNWKTWCEFDNLKIYKVE